MFKKIKILKSRLPFAITTLTFLLVNLFVLTLTRIVEAKIVLLKSTNPIPLNEILPQKFKVIHRGSESVIIKANNRGKAKYFKLINTNPPDLNYSLLGPSGVLDDLENYLNRPIEGIMSTDAGFEAGHKKSYVHLPEKIWISKTTEVLPGADTKYNFSYNCVLEFSEEKFADVDLINYLKEKIHSTKDLRKKINETVQFTASTFHQAVQLITSLERDYGVQYMDFKLENMVVSKNGVITLIDPDSLFVKPKNSALVPFPKNDPKYDLPTILNDMDAVNTMKWGERIIQGMNTFNAADNYYRIGLSTLKLLMLGFNELLSEKTGWHSLFGKRISATEQNSLGAASQVISDFLNKKEFDDREEYLKTLDVTIEIIKNNLRNITADNSVAIESLLSDLKFVLTPDRNQRALFSSGNSKSQSSCQRIFMDKL
ncbi:MAG: hypothetical protein ACXVCP_20115 [Bdellovibrio sp.]